MTFLDDEWRSLAACIGTPVELWFEPSPRHHRTAIAVCASCPVTDECLRDALATPRFLDSWGIRGGLTAEQRRKLRHTPRSRRVTA